MMPNQTQRRLLLSLIQQWGTNMKEVLTDPYLLTINQVGRLVKEWKQHNGIIVAFDYDNCVFDYHKKGHSYEKVIKQLRSLGRMGCTLICFTCSDPSRFPEIRQHLDSLNLVYHGINIDPDNVPFKGRKIFYNVFYDDRAGLGQIYEVMTRVIQQITHLMLVDIDNSLSLEDFENRAKGKCCVFSGQPFRRGEWFYNNERPAAFPEFIPSGSLVPDITKIMSKL